MVERGNGNEPVQEQETILSSEMVETILQSARHHLHKYGSVIATLFVKLDHDERAVIPLAIPETHEEKQMYFTLLGVTISEEGRQLQEAILLSESWVLAPIDREFPEVSPHQHPGRKEAITLAGRDASGLHYVFAIQPFHRNEQNQPVFEELDLQHFGEDIDKNLYSTGLLDYLFPPVDSTWH
jgi:hypothetical protein